MSERKDRKMQEVVVARYSWRHEAEFAAGFLRDAGIPYRLQIDDPALGLSVSTSATIWVLGIDERRARDVLDVGSDHVPRLGRGGSRPHREADDAHPDPDDRPEPEQPDTGPGRALPVPGPLRGASAGGGGGGTGRGTADRPPSGTDAGSASPTSSPGSSPPALRRRDRPGKPAQTTLPGRSRVVAVLGGGGIAALGRVFFNEGSSVPFAEGVLAGLAIVLILAGLVGHAPRALRDLLSALTGDAP